MANRYWVGGTGTWNTTSTTNWSTSSGGSSGASVPTTSDSVFFDQAGTYTVTMTGALNCNDITVSAGTVTFATGTTPTLAISGSMSLLTGTVWSSNGAITFNATTTGKTVTTNGVTLSGSITFNGTGGEWTLSSALTSASSITVTAGAFNTSSSGNYSITTTQFNSSGTAIRTINLNASSVNLSTTSSLAFNIPITTNLTFNAGTSQINLSGGTSGISSGGLTFYNVSFTSINISVVTITGSNTFNTLSFTGRSNTAGIAAVTFSANQTISTLTIGAGLTAAYRIFLASSTIGTQRTLSVTTFTTGAAECDFRDIAITGSASPISGTRFGDCKGNSGITFPAAKTVYYRQTGSANWGQGGTGSWSATSGGSLDATQFPLAQDTAVFPSATYPASGSTTTINANYNIGTIDMSARTSNTMTLATGTTTPTIYGNWITGTGITISGTGTLTFAGQGAQTITSAGKTFTQVFNINTVGGSVTLQDAFSSSLSGTAISLIQGTFDASSYNVTFSGAASGVNVSGTGTRTMALGSGTWTISGSGNSWNATTISNLTITGTGTITMSSGSAKTFIGGGVQTYPTLNQGGAGALTISGSNKFTAMTNTVIGSVLFTGGTTNEFTTFDLNGVSGNLLTLGSTNTTQAILKKPSAWNVGANSTDGGNNTGLSFI